MSERRKILIDGANFSIDADIIKNKLTIIEKSKNEKLISIILKQSIRIKIKSNVF